MSEREEKSTEVSVLVIKSLEEWNQRAVTNELEMEPMMTKSDRMLKLLVAVAFKLLSGWLEEVYLSVLDATSTAVEAGSVRISGHEITVSDGAVRQFTTWVTGFVATGAVIKALKGTGQLG